MNATIYPSPRYLRWLSMSIVALLLLTAGTNAVVNPYGIFDTPQILGLNAVKVRAGQQREMFKATGVQRIRPAILILGNSRAEIGFDPQSREWPNGPVYNMAQAGGNLRLAARMLSSVADQPGIRTVVLGLDLPEFLTVVDSPAAPEPLTIGRANAFKLSLEDYASSLLAFDTLQNSARTIAGQRDPHTEQLTSLGFNPLLEYPVLVRREGQHALFAQKNAEYARRYVADRFTLHPSGQDNSPDVEQLLHIVRFCRAHDLQLKLVIYPYHAQLLTLLREVGLWDSYEEWKRSLTQIVRQESTDGFHPELWDFGTFEAYNTETPPAPSDRSTTLQWYWEAGHFRAALGEVVLRRIFAGDAGFGLRLTPQNIDAHLAAVRDGEIAYRSEHQAEVEDIAALVRRLQPRGNGHE